VLTHLEIRMQPQQAQMAEAEAEPLAATGTDDPRPLRPPRAAPAAPRVAASGGAAVAASAPDNWGKVPRNAACPCGSGKKYKHCHGRLN
jgi:preprotein translocase subunit SecA